MFETSATIDKLSAALARAQAEIEGAREALNDTLARVDRYRDRAGMARLPLERTH
jgi:uncharacterized protein YPO0396